MIFTIEYLLRGRRIIYPVRESPLMAIIIVLTLLQPAGKDCPRQVYPFSREKYPDWSANGWVGV